MSVVGGLPGAPAVAGTVPVASTQAARDGGLALVLGPAGDGGALSLWDPAGRATPLSVDFLAGRQGYRLAADRARHERLVKALGRCRDGVQGVLDLTAGLARDAALMAAAGYPVSMVERQPVLHALIADALARAQGQGRAYFERMTGTPVRATPDFLRQVAEGIGLDVPTFVADVTSDNTNAVLREATGLKRIFGFIGTPALVVGRTVLQGAISETNLRQLIDIEREHASSSPCA